MVPRRQQCEHVKNCDTDDKGDCFSAGCGGGGVTAMHAGDSAASGGAADRSAQHNWPPQQERLLRDSHGGRPGTPRLCAAAQDARPGQQLPVLDLLQRNDKAF